MEMKEVKIDFVDALKTSFTWGIKNLASIIGAVVLWILTIWVPYINVGTTIAMMSIPLVISRGKVISPTFIFDKKYRQYMGEVFLLLGLQNMGIVVGLAFLIAPGIIIAIAWSLSILFVLDKGLSPTDAMVKSNQYTNGNKGRMFLAMFIIIIGLAIINFILGLIPFVGGILCILVTIACAPMFISMQAYFYRKLVLDREIGGIEYTVVE